VSSADMLNMAGSLLAVTWYIEKRECARWFDYMIFFFIIAFTSLCKGLIALVVPIIAVSTDMVLQKTWKHHIKLSVALSILPGLILYFLPFFASTYFSNPLDQQNGLYSVYRENILRYFKPFDHQGSLFTYFYYLPIYLLPWTFFFMAALLWIKSRLKSMALYSKWLIWTFFLLFLFFTLSGSRRSYYILPIVPFAILMTADWLMFVLTFCKNRQKWLSWFLVSSFAFLFLFIVLIPVWYYSEFGVARFAQQLKNEAEKTRPWSTWHVTLLNAETKFNFYLQLPPTTKDLSLNQVKAILNTKPEHVIFISRKCYLPFLLPYFAGYRLLASQPPMIHFSFLKDQEDNMPIAFISNR
jgi:4-amino-4-deoxy-L-arabinose transferase-like glycosyltransferase